MRVDYTDQLLTVRLVKWKQADWQRTGDFTTVAAIGAFVGKTRCEIKDERREQ